MKPLHKMIFLLSFITAASGALYWLFNDSKTMTVSPKNFDYLVHGDQLHRGRSVTSLTVVNNIALLQCELKPSPNFKWPYCGLSIQISHDPTQGVDLTGFHTIRLHLDFERLDSHDLPSMRFYLRNFNPEYSVKEKEYSYKYIGLEITPTRGNPIINIPMNSLQVKPWWIIDNNIAPQHAGPEFSNITIIELSTGENSHSGEYQLEVQNIEFVGYYISLKSYLGWLSLMWGIGLLAALLVTTCRGQKLVLTARTRQEHVRNLTKALRRRNVEFKEFAHKDTLTGAMSRSAIRNWLEKNFEVDLYKGRDLAAIFITIDHFNQINEQYGHKVGNDILREFTLLVLELLKPTYQVVRWADEEFMVFCPDTTLDEAVQLAELLCEKIEIRLWAHKHTLTASLGVTSLGDEMTSDMLLRAGEALHLAKHNGRNRVEVNIAIP